MARIVSGRYLEEENVTMWLRFDNADEAKISLVFARRLAALARDNNTIIYISEGFRSFEKQQQFYDAYLSGKGNYAAKPDLKNGSQHQYGFAADFGDQKGFWKSKSDKEWMPFSKLKQSSLNKYGLCVPLNNIDAKLNQRENWHVTPIEVYNSGYKGNRCDFLQKDDLILNWDYETKIAKEKEVNIKKINDLIQKLALRKVITSVDYWKRVLEGKETAKAEWLIILLERLLG